MAAVGLLSAANAQGFFGSVQAELDACGSDNFISLGCFGNFILNAGTLFNFAPGAFNPQNPSSSFPDFDPGSRFNSTVTPLSCARVCRGFGYKFAAVRNNLCSCGIQLPAGYLASTNSVCNLPCNGDQAQTCGGTVDAQVYVDPTFADNALVPVTNSNPGLANYYRHLGCYNSPAGFPTQDIRASALVANIDVCFNLCAGMGYPLVTGRPQEFVIFAQARTCRAAAVTDLYLAARFFASAEPHSDPEHSVWI